MNPEPYLILPGVGAASLLLILFLRSPALGVPVAEWGAELLLASTALAVAASSSAFQSLPSEVLSRTQYASRVQGFVI